MCPVQRREQRWKAVDVEVLVARCFEEPTAAGGVDGSESGAVGNEDFVGADAKDGLVRGGVKEVGEVGGFRADVGAPEEGERGEFEEERAWDGGERVQD